MQTFKLLPVRFLSPNGKLTNGFKQQILKGKML